MHSISACRNQAGNCNSRLLDTTICFFDRLFTRRHIPMHIHGCETLLARTFFRLSDPPATQQRWPRCHHDNIGRRFIGRPTVSGSPAGHLVGSSAHPIRQLEQIVFAHPVGQRVRQLP
jgi:hypothetical protein